MKNTAALCEKLNADADWISDIHAGHKYVHTHISLVLLIILIISMVLKDLFHPYYSLDEMKSINFYVINLSYFCQTGNPEF